MASLLLISGPAMAWDIHTLDKGQVISLLEAPDQTEDIKNTLQVKIYRAKDLAPLVGTGCIYDNNERLIGQTFLFQGEMGKQAAVRLKELGFTVLEDKEDSFRFLGQDDDTGRPLVVHVGHSNGLTVVSTFEKGFYDRRRKLKEGEN